MIETEKFNEEVQNTGIGMIPLPIGQAIECMSPERLARLGLPLIRTIAKSTSPTVIFPAIQNLKSEDPLQVEELLATEIALAEISFWDIASKMHLVQENGGVETLQADGHQFQKGEDRSAFLARVLSERPADLSGVLSGLLERSSGEFVGKTFHIYHGRLSSAVVVERLAKLNAMDVQIALMKAFEGKGYGEFCQVIPAGDGHSIGYLINRGSRRITNAVLDREEQRRFRDDRKIKTDTVFINTETGNLWIHCQGKNDAQTYATIMSELLGDRQAFSRRQSFDLSTFLRKEVGSDLLRAAQQVRLVRAEVRLIDVQLTNNGTFKLSAKRWDPCLTESFHGIDAIHPSNQMRTIKLRLVLTADGKQYADVEIKSGSLKIGAGLDPLVANELLSKLGVWKAYDNC